MTIRTKLAHFYRFIGYRPCFYGGVGIAVGFVLFAFDLALATMLQRFFMSTGLVTLGKTMPLGVALQSPMVEASVLIAISILRAITIWANGYVGGLCQVSVEVEKRNALSQWAVSHGGQEIGKIMSYFNDIILGAAAAIGAIFYVLARFIILGGLILMMLNYSASMTLFVMALIFVIAPLQMIIDKIISRNAKNIQASLANSVSLLARSIKNNLFLSLHNLTAHEVSHIQSVVNEYGKTSIHYYSLSSMRSVFPQVMGLASVVMIAMHGQSSFSENPAMLVAYLYLVLRLFQVLSDIARVSSNLRLNYPRISILYKWWSEHIENAAPQVATPVSLDHTLIGWQAKNIGYVWPNGHATSIQNMNFEIKAGATALIVGPSGAGKTTLFHILLGLLIPTQGTLYAVDENGISSEIRGRISQCISYVGPDPFLVAGSVRDQLLIGNALVADDTLIEALHLVHAEFVFDFKDGLNHVLTEQGHGLSAGQKQRLALARALLRKPAVLLLDEATANLDEKTEGLIVQLINRLRGTMTILVVSHRPHNDLIVDTLIDLKPIERNAV